MGKLKDLRDQLISDLAVIGVPVIDDWWLQAEPPCVLITPPLGGPYVEAGELFASFVLNVDAVVLVRRTPSDDGREQLENILEDVLRNTVDWSLKGVDPPSTATRPDSTVEFFGTVVHLGKTLNL